MAEILFRADHFEGVLAGLPTIPASLPPPATEGTESTAFPGMRKTRREIYRLLSNDHYEHLVEALRILETVHAAGLSFGHLLSTTGRQMFSSLLDEALAAEHFLLRGYDVATIQRTGLQTPDLHVKGTGVEMAIEVYSPREWLEIEEWMGRLLQFLKYSDVPRNYRARARTRVAQRAGRGASSFRPTARTDARGDELARRARAPSRETRITVPTVDRHPEAVPD
jgi:hypothetical protein